MSAKRNENAADHVLVGLVAVGNVVKCMTCGATLTDCPSCGDWQCQCKVPWAANMRPADRRLAPRQHYNKQYLPYTRNPYDAGDPADYDNLRSDEMLPL